MSNSSRTGKLHPDDARLDRAVRLVAGTGLPVSRRSLLRHGSASANLLAAVVALGLPNSESFRNVFMNSSMSFDFAVLSAHDLSSNLPDMLGAVSNSDDSPENATLTEEDESDPELTESAPRLEEVEIPDPLSTNLMQSENQEG